MKKILFALVALAMSVSVSAKVTVYGGVSSLGVDGLDMGFGGGANYMMENGEMSYGLDVNYNMWSGEVLTLEYDYSIVEIMPIFRYGKKFFGQAGVGLELMTAEVAGLSASSTEFGIMFGAGYNINEMFVIEARGKLIDGELGYGANFGFKF